MAKRRLMITREDVERNRPGASWVTDHKLTVYLVPAVIAAIIVFPMVIYAPTWISTTYVVILAMTPLAAGIWFLRSM